MACVAKIDMNILKALIMDKAKSDSRINKELLDRLLLNADILDRKAHPYVRGHCLFHVELTVL